MTYPDSPAIRELWHGILELQQSRGGDPWIARKLYAVFRRAGLTDVQAQGRAWTITADEKEKLRVFIDGAREITRQSRDGLLEGGLATQEHLTQAESEYRRLLDHTDTFIFAGFCRAVGIKTSKGD